MTALLQVLPPLAGGIVVWLMGALAVYTAPHLAETLFGHGVFVLAGVVAGALARPGRRWITCACLLVLGATARFLLGSAWAYYSVLLPVAFGLAVAALLACGFPLGVWIATVVERRYALAALALALALQFGFLLQRDAGLLLLHARPRAEAFGTSRPSWFFFDRGERVQGLCYVARQRVAADPDGAQRILGKALAAATQVPSGNTSLVSAVASAQIACGFYDDAERSIAAITAPFERFQSTGFTAVELQRAGAHANAKRLFEALSQELEAREQPLSGMSEVYLLSRRQIEAGFYEDAQATIERFVPEPTARRQQLLFLAIDMAKAGARRHAGPLFEELLDSAEALPTPEHRDHELFEIGSYQAEAGLIFEASASAERIRSPEKKRELLAVLGKQLPGR